ncbi:MAG: Type 1 glutamine amidotransferase-like domain-containing protein [Christensenellaceae bacterium]|jgi:peptidase E|nr:Type 1 glutamine amidotransferase-like domain-containing protein [Christensenellaceae bacterium]
MLSSGVSALPEGFPRIEGLRAALIPSAQASQKARERSLPAAKAALLALGAAECVSLPLESARPKDFASFGLLYFLGGNAFLLTKIIRERGLGPAIAAFERERQVIASSGGALALGQTMAHIERIDPSMNRRYGLMDLSGLGLAPVSICPHRGRFIEKYEGFLEAMANFERESGQTIALLEDGQGVFSDSGSWRVFG